MCTTVIESVRNIETVLNQILDIIPNDYSKKSELEMRLNYVIEDSKYRSPELMCIAWQDASTILKDYLLADASRNLVWGWEDDIFELFSNGKWGKSVNKIGSPLYC